MSSLYDAFDAEVDTNGYDATLARYTARHHDWTAEDTRQAERELECEEDGGVYRRVWRYTARRITDYARDAQAPAHVMDCLLACTEEVNRVKRHASPEVFLDVSTLGWLRENRSDILNTAFVGMSEKYHKDARRFLR